MPQKITNAEGVEETVYSQAELDEMRAADKLHVDNKLKEFETGKTAQELANQKRDEEVKEAKRIADEALAKVGEEAQRRITTVKNYVAEAYVGQDADLKKKLDENFDLISAGRLAKGLDVNSEGAIKEIYQQAAAMGGIGGGASPHFPMVGGGAPGFTPPVSGVSDEDHNKFLKETGYVHPKPAGTQGNQ